MRPRLDQLEALLWISKLGSFRSAARKLHLSQPAVSSRIRELENQLGISLLDRSRHRPRVTPEGLEVLRHAEQMIGLAENFRTRFGERDRLPKSIRMGAADSFALTHLSVLLARLAELHPGTHIDLDIGFSTHLDRKLQAGELDIRRVGLGNQSDEIPAPGLNVARPARGNGKLDPASDVGSNPIQSSKKRFASCGLVSTSGSQRKARASP